MKVLISRIGAMGDVLHALPAVATLRAACPDWQIDWAVDPRWAPLLVNSEGSGPIVDRVHLAETRLWSSAPFSLETLRSITALRRALRAAHYDIAVDLQGTLRSAVITRFSAAPVRVGYVDPREPPAARFYTRKFPHRAAHVVYQGVDLLQRSCGLLSLPDDPPAPTHIEGRYDPATNPILPHEPWADDWAAEEAPPDRRLALLAPGAGWGAKQWPAARFAALARALHGQGFDVGITAVRKDDDLALSVVTGSKGVARLIVCDIAGLLAITRRAALKVGSDSGPTHLAGLLGIPLVALYGPTSPARNGPWGPGPMRVLRDKSAVTSYKHVATPDPSLACISVEQVIRACHEVTAEPSDLPNL